MKRILFVDDEIDVLNALRNRLRRERGRWEMVFANGGAEALLELEKTPFDVIVSDMRMPQMDGAELLGKVKDKYPGIARIVLSGYAEREAVIKTLSLAHQFLNKPCDVEVLCDTIDRTCMLQTLLGDDALRRLVGQVGKLPSVPETYWELTRVASDPDAGASEFARVIEKDPAMCAKVLQLVNSGYFGTAQRVTSITRAVGHLGADLLRALALVGGVFAALEGTNPVAGFSFDQLQRHSMAVAQIARAICADDKQSETAFLAGIVHDIGQIIFVRYAPKKFEEAIALAQDGEPLHAAEKARLGTTHAEVGAYLIGMWGLPYAIVESVAHSHDLGGVPEKVSDVTLAVYVGDALAHEIAAGAHGGCAESGLSLEALNSLGLAAELPKWRAMAEEALKSSA